MSHSNSSDFFERVYEVVRQIPEGRVTTYGIIAQCLGMRKSARMVGWAMNAAHSRPDVPAHRVVNRVGMLTGKHHFGGPRVMQQLLEQEGHVIVDNQIVDFDIVLWKPTEAV